MENTSNDYEKKLSLKKLRLLKELDQKTVATHIGLSQSGYTKKEKKEREFSASELKKLADLFEKSLDDMYIIITN
jgi:transcriptional regulator with XRE-family HTH domain